jgi:dipeptidyl aminopeptidase/acylaminoacyl peptidase
MKRIGNYGSWGSPITADTVTAVAVALSEPRLDGDDLYWIESLPAERGRNVVVRRNPDGSIETLTPDPLYARSQVYSYGGGAYTVDRGVVYFVDYNDNQIYRHPRGGAPVRLTSNTACLYGDLCVDPSRNRLIAVREQRPNGDVINALHTLVAVDWVTGQETVLDDGYDFYSSPTLNTDASRLAWLSWRHPNMPWTSTDLCVATFAPTGELAHTQIVAAGAHESMFQPQWSPDGTLYLISDRSGFWNLYRWTGTDLEPVAPRDADFAPPQWTLGQSTYAFVSATEIIYSFTRNGMWYLGRLDTLTRDASDYPQEFAQLSWVRAAAGNIVLRCSSVTTPAAIVMVDFESGELAPVRYSVPPKDLEDLSGYFSSPQALAFPTHDGEIAHAFYYRPQNPDWDAQASERPPLLVMSHGGPTSAASAGLDLSRQFWTSRGFDVNYRGSTGYGRAYREKLYGQWGLIDVTDCIDGALHLASCGEVDDKKLLVTGGSAGGYTTLCGLTFHAVFAAGASYYGISDISALAIDTHKFELHYMDWLVEPYTPGNVTYHDRSPINFADRLSAPVIFLHGEEDPVVPVNQAQKMFSALQNRGLSTSLIVFQGERHGFRQPRNQRQALESELLFYAMVVLRIPLIS